MIITKDYLMFHRTDKGAWTRSQFEALGLPINSKFTPLKGWMKSIIGNDISPENMIKFEKRLTANEVRKLKKLSKKEISKAKRKEKAYEKRLKEDKRIIEYKARFGLEPIAPVKIIVENRKPVNAILPHNKRKLTKTPKKRAKKEDNFYSSKEWRRLRYEALKLHGRQCLCCGQKAPNVELHVDHIKPRSKHPELELDINNLQILCQDCNLGKSNRDSIDYRVSTIV